ncbi:flagellar hook-length control protein-like protein [endosymbiont of Tevnia jerichonana (vent Tica)]|jgi:flagellar hook-length control protein FliK|uniref:Flagellar hook-length control protein-like protein n=3 Tax=Gammaproteobacteria TaxID=1236 RepID=G2FCJ0_9GAMM|nr:flagellar hook-length control protein-like protein [endosymbiont of Tevnia jerichonana (vent Tica)]
MEGASELVVDAEQASDFMKFLEFAGMQLAAALPDGAGLPHLPATGGKALPPVAGGLPRMEQLLMPGATDMAAQQQVQFDRLLDGAGRLQMTSALAGQDESAAAVGESRLVDSLLSGGLAGVQSNASATRSLPAMGLRLDMPVGQPEWNQSLGDRLQWMIGRNIQQAEVRLSPPHLGPLEIRVSLHNDQASVSFVAQHAATRDAIEAALPRLREMLGEANINLADVDVGQRDPRTFDHQQEKGGGAEADQGGDDRQAANAMPLQQVQPVSRGLVDEHV